MTFVTLLTSAIEAFRIPAGGAILPRLLNKEYFTLGKAANYSSSRMAELLGYVLAGLIIAWVGASGALWIDAITFLLSAGIIALIRYKDEKPSETRSAKTVFDDLHQDCDLLKPIKPFKRLSDWIAY